MKKLFGTILTILVIASIYTMYSSQTRSSEVPVITWRTDANAQREDQVMLFREWLVENGHVLRDKKGNPVNYTQAQADTLNRAYGTDGKPLDSSSPHFVKAGSPRPNGDVVLETANNQSTLIQAVSGMAGDVFDTDDVLGYSQLGVAMDISEDARKNGYGLDSTYPGMAGLLTDMDGKQCAYPCNGGSPLLWINLSTLEKYGFKRPPQEWTPEEFEEMAKAYVEKANQGLHMPTCFFAPPLESEFGTNLLQCICRSNGVDLFNETQTRCIADTPLLRKTIRMFYRWTYTDRIVPTAADIASMSSDAGSGGTEFSNFLSGKYALIMTTRYCLIVFRKIEKAKQKTTQFGISQLPMNGYKNSVFDVRAAMPYKGSKHPELTKLFFKFLSGRVYNAYIVEYGDGLPPNPEAVGELMANVRKIHPNENDCNEFEFRLARTTALPRSGSPYVKTGSSDWLKNGINRYFNNRCTLEEAGKYIQDRYNQEIEIAKDANPKTRQHWERAWALQQKIDIYKKEGKKIPVEWVTNPFYRKYYHDKGMLDEKCAE